MPTNQTRAEHLQWAKDRALAYLEPKKTDPLGRLGQRLRHAVVPMSEAEQVIDAWNSFVSDLGKHSETQGHTAIMLGSMQVLSGHLRTVGAMREFIQGTN
jgi:hypothetical protein